MCCSTLQRLLACRFCKTWPRSKLFSSVEEKGDKLAEGIFHCFVISSKIQDALLTHISLLLGQVGHFVSEFKVQIITSWLLLELELRAASTYDRRYCPCNLNTEPELLLRDEETAAGVRMYYVGQFVLKLYTLYLRVCKHSYM